MNLIVIPARGGSKGLPGKNIRNLVGKPLIYWTIDQALQSESADMVVVSTDDRDIARVSEACGATVIARPQEISGDEASTESAVRHVIQTLAGQGIEPDNIILLQCTSPIRSELDIDKAFSLYVRRKADSLLSVVPCHKFLWSRSSDGFGVPENYKPGSRPRRQDLTNSFQENGSIYIFSLKCFEEYQSRLGGRIELYVMSEESGYEIDSLTDFEIVEALMKKGIE
ncbi:acylneuraminate cytidylyltransferase family protein [Marinobacter sp.]|uniref:acylneuraminate cytidylyltransferase family protein n=1 Tax=Marinobacter sp. TaxID=50741 RepID=UPI002B26AB05|nr:acylneuraminate cytidylyltransferase family protein [Marinobacter sp.]